MLDHKIEQAGPLVHRAWPRFEVFVQGCDIAIGSGDLDLQLIAETAFPKPADEAFVQCRFHWLQRDHAGLCHRPGQGKPVHQFLAACAQIGVNAQAEIVGRRLQLQLFGDGPGSLG